MSELHCCVPGLIGRQMVRSPKRDISVFVHTPAASDESERPSSIVSQPHSLASGGGVGGGGDGAGGGDGGGGAGGGDGGSGGEGG